jgi:Fic family protein
MNSTRIEGNTLNSAEVGEAVATLKKPPNVMQQEVRNYWRALEWIEEQIEGRRSMSEEFIRELHAIIIVRGVGRRGQRSEYRKKECPVVDSGTKRIDYAPPEPDDVSVLMGELVEWWLGSEAGDFPGPVRAGLLAHRFVSIHPFSDGNGRTARALATTDLWRSGYDMRGFLSLEEHYTADLKSYYESLQMGLPVNFYEGRHDPDHTRWLEYFLATMARAAEGLREEAISLHAPQKRTPPPWDGLRRVQQQLLTRLLTRGLSEGEGSLVFAPIDVEEWFGISGNTALDWLKKWREEEFVQPAKPGGQRIRSYTLSPQWVELIKAALRSTTDKTS